MGPLKFIHSLSGEAYDELRSLPPLLSLTLNTATGTTSRQMISMRASMLSLVLSVLATSVTDVQASCEDADWSSSFNNKGLSMCDNSGKFMTGLYRDDRGNTYRLKRLDGARCCSRPTPWRQSSNMVIHSNWW